MPAEVPVPDYFPRSRVRFYENKPLGRGSRMAVHSSINRGPTVLRAPRTTEEELFTISAKTGEVFDGDNGDPRISPITKRDIDFQEVLREFIGRNMAPVMPFVDEDMEGRTRVYSTQRRVTPARDMSFGWRPTDDLSLKARKSFARLIRGIRELMAEEKCIPDLVGRGNVVLTEREQVVLVDVNNVRPWLDKNEWSRQEMTQELWEAMIYAEGGNLLQNFLAPGYVDEKGAPVGDASLYELRRWEMGLAGHHDAASAEARSIEEIKEDPLYLVIDAERNRWRDLIFSFMIRGDLKVPRQGA